MITQREGSLSLQAAPSPAFEEVLMSDYLMKDAAIATIRCFMLIIGNRSVLKSLITLAYVSLFTAIFMMQPSSLKAEES